MRIKPIHHTSVFTESIDSHNHVIVHSRGKRFVCTLQVRLGVRLVTPVAKHLLSQLAHIH